MSTETSTIIKSETTGYTYTVTFDASIDFATIEWDDADGQPQTVDAVATGGILRACDVPADDSGLIAAAVADLAAKAEPAPVVVEVVSVEPSSCSDHDGAVDATIYLQAQGEWVTCEVTLLPGEADGLLTTWGPSRDYWASSALRGLLARVGNAREIIDAIVDAVRAAL